MSPTKYAKNAYLRTSKRWFFTNFSKKLSIGSADFIYYNYAFNSLTFTMQDVALECWC